jgi:hypothetical protein
MTMHYAYFITDGRAHDLRFVPDGYKLQPGELEGDGDQLPRIDAISETPAPPRLPTLADVLAVLSPEQKIALQSRLSK